MGAYRWAESGFLVEYEHSSSGVKSNEKRKDRGAWCEL